MTTSFPRKFRYVPIGERFFFEAGPGFGTFVKIGWTVIRHEGTDELYLCCDAETRINRFEPMEFWDGEENLGPSDGSPPQRDIPDDPL